MPKKKTADTTTPPEPSGAMKLVTLVWEHNREGTGPSWQRLNTSMAEAVSLAISAGMRFHKDDFRDIFNKYRGGYWFGTDNDHSQGERFYSMALAFDDISACQSFESWKGRAPFIYQGKRVGHGSELEGFAPGQRVQVKSFAADGLSLTACGYYGSTLKKRYTISLEDMRAGARADRLKKNPPIPAWGKTLVAAVKVVGCAEARKTVARVLRESTPESIPEKFLTEFHLGWARRNLKSADVPPAWATILKLS